MIDTDLVETARLYVRRFFGKHMPDNMAFHDLEHTLTVVRATLEIGRESGLNDRELHLLELCALFHDTGYANTHRGHEEESVRIADQFLKRKPVSERERKRVATTILATRLGHTPRGVVQQVIRDADSCKAGQSDFIQKSFLLRKEMEQVLGTYHTDAEWAAENLEYLRNHSFHTVYARSRYGGQKSLNIKALEQALKGLEPSSQEPHHAKNKFFDRDLSWLSFNDRVLQEAKDERVPLFERIKFLAIYSNNLDEFYRVRVASLRSISSLGKSTRSALGGSQKELVERINVKTLAQQQEFGAVYRGVLLPALEAEGVRILNETELSKKQHAHVLDLFRTKVAPAMETLVVRSGIAPFIEDRKLYMATVLRSKGKERTVLLNIPSEELGRFHVLPSAKGRTDIIFLDDIIRVAAPVHFKGNKVLGSYAFKLSRDAELYLEDEYADKVVDKVRRSLRKRRTGVPSRFLFDQNSPEHVVKQLRTMLGLKRADMVPGGRYHNFSDLFSLPLPYRPELRDPPLKALRHPAIHAGTDILAAIRERDHLLHFPYHDFAAVLEWLDGVSTDPDVVSIAITLYRVAEHSEVCKTLIRAAENGKRVTVFVEVQARFDEHSNLFWGEKLEQAGAEVLYSYEGLKVHCKLCLVERKEQGRMRRYAYLGTGNFNERTALLYADSALLTTKDALTHDVASVFAHLKDRNERPKLKRSMMAPIDLRSGLEGLIDKEIENARRGHAAGVTLKLNSLEDQALISKLYDASRVGVQIRLIIRGICCLIPGIKGMSENIKAISIVDRFLEHVRAYVFHDKGRERLYLASADWMGRNLDRRIEMAFQVEDRALKQEVLHMLELQWNDTVKARRIDAKQTNPYMRKRGKNKTSLRSQEATRIWLKKSAKQTK